MATVLNRLARAHTFDGLDHDLVAYCMEHAANVSARRGDRLIQQGERGRLVYVVRSGYAKLVSVSLDGHEVLVGIAGPRDVFGQTAVVDEEREYLVSATALTSMTAAVWARTKVVELARRFPELHARLDKEMLGNLELVLGRLHTVSDGRVSQRLARALLELAERHGEPSGTGLMIAPPLTRQDLASLTGTTLYTVSRLLGEWESRGLVSSDRARIHVADPVGLGSIATASANT
jgi:CRP/FNR family transcriptional regulator, nitrogen oxide reductase regulator